VDGERLVMGFIYEAMDQAKEQIKTAYKDRVAKYGPIWKIMIKNGTINSIALYMAQCSWVFSEPKVSL